MIPDPMGNPREVAAPQQTSTLRLPVPSTSPICTRVMMGLLVALWLATTVYGLLLGAGWNGSQNTIVLVMMGAKANALIIAGQYWRLLTANFLHAGILHLGFNLYALLAFGTETERRFGHARFLALYLLAGLGGSVLSFIGNDAVAVGASGAIFGLLGAMIVYFLTYRGELGAYGSQRLRSLLMVAGLNLFLGLSSSGIDNLGHIGGLLVGLVLGWAFCPRYEVAQARPGAMPVLADRYEPARAVAVAALVLAALAALVLWGVRRGGG